MFLVSCTYRFLRLALERLTRENHVSSPHVALVALKGCHIQINDGARIDDASEVGSYTYIGCYTYVTRAKISRYVSIANNVSIGQGEHDLTRLSTSSTFYADAWATLTRGKCEIGSDSWIGVDAVIRRGVKIGIGAVVGANAVVTKDVPDYAIVAGSPAKLIRYRFPEDVRARLLQSRWWLEEKEQAAAILKKIEAEAKRT